jgi:hypothetical protein
MWFSLFPAALPATAYEFLASHVIPETSCNLIDNRCVCLEITRGIRGIIALKLKKYVRRH